MFTSTVRFTKSCFVTSRLLKEIYVYNRCVYAEKFTPLKYQYGVAVRFKSCKSFLFIICFQVAPYEIWRMERSEFSNSSSISSEGSVQDLSQKTSQSDEASSNRQETVNQQLSDVSFV